jgi:hypothetical protein
LVPDGLSRLTGGFLSRRKDVTDDRFPETREADLPARGLEDER